MTASGKNWLIQLAYEGRNYAGWQIQPDTRTVQGELNQALKRLYSCDIETWGCSRTDSGVHALSQMVTFHPPESPPIPVEKVHYALNQFLPPDIRILTLTEKPENFHARHAACGKAYTYVLHEGPLNSPFLNRWCWELKDRLDLAAMQDAASHLIGEKDFTAFSVHAKGQEHVDPVKTMRSFYLRREDGFLLITVIGTSFLYRMVRRFVGYLTAVGQGKITPEATPGILTGDSFQFETAPAAGLFLEAVFFDPKELEYQPQGLPFMKL